ncbi:hypothetical protein GCM10017714_08350 [Curtobacterium pusillum]|uniref:MarR family transcriptional regulator n=1 Tax=Curtobacterium pusillum TaxID=69373 RepID=A0ABX2MBE2_9MICO|nr:MarR family transcriptional regulator [Curtobacterium pusillum]NUU13072.1 MarR family transcriptional regulator [Curtobacterium pusillum]GLK30098.1 hypothetical protein GCM10017610_03830 [Curtobacterium pusillum]
MTFPPVMTALAATAVNEPPLLEAVSAFAALEHQNSQVIGVLSSRLGIGKTDLRALVYLSRNPGSMPKALAEHLQLSTGATTNLIDRMEAAGLLTRVPNPDDRRSSVLELAETGVQAAHEVSVFYRHVFREAVEPHHFKVLSAAMRSIGDAIGRAAEAADQTTGG